LLLICLPPSRLTMKLVLALLVVYLAVASAQEKVVLKFFAESLCPYCKAFIQGPLNETLQKPDIVAITDYEMVPWGNAYYSISECSSPGYHCWASHCTTNPVGDCFTSKIVCQHGTSECYGNAVEACIKQNYPDDVIKFANFVYCFEGQGNSGAADLRRCAMQFGYDATKISTCATAETGIDIEAKKTLQYAADHTGTPWVTINGRGEAAPDNLIASICRAYTGPKPASCPQMKQEQKLSLAN